MLDVNLTFQFPNFQSEAAFSLAKGEIKGLFGRSGIGKSSLLHAIAGLNRRFLGHILFDQRVWNDMQTFVKPQDRKVGLVFQDYALFPNLDADQNIRYNQQISETEVQKLINVLELRSVLFQHPDQLSGGQKQRVAIGRALAYNPDVLLMDEPFAALDSSTKRNISAYLKDYFVQQNKTVIISSHLIEDLNYFTNDIFEMTLSE
ncbi:hypothetical protein BFP72_10970 [Reichenbachiella sp. 5M10]|uniref:ATP-binding cassette domain-containing protein n=1 Tax=Reichenbachiella sp. 5M10 TaxID=1889772 RepID=UPI000C6ABFFF|nr:ATP-binding cassette domain-containing protein [Reichenbachiella sp. 5M10]PIB37520.1 hypothetical protein BFP72_10970 [Reichenbachiella sp. 5M10]